MSQRLQVLMDESEFRELRRLAKQRRQTVAELVRSTVREALRSEPVIDVDRKRAALRAAARYEFPPPDLRAPAAPAGGQEPGQP